MNLKRILSIIFVLLLSTQILPIKSFNSWLNDQVTFTSVEEINETHNNTNSTPATEQEEKLMSHIFVGIIFKYQHIQSAQKAFSEYRIVHHAQPFIEQSEIPPIFFS